jgi:E3 ubiquitin-protein ligase HERC2
MKEFPSHTMSTLLSNGQVFELIQNGKNIPLTREKAKEFYTKALEAKLGESTLQVQALLKGIGKTFDQKFLRMVSWKYLEHRVVGLNEISIERLKEITAYRNCSETHEVIKRFWQVLESFSNDEKICYLRFVWGRTRLPLKEEEVIENHTI